MSELGTSDTNSLTSITEKCKHHPSITAIKNQMDKIEKPNFGFKEMETMQMIPLFLFMEKILTKYLMNQRNIWLRFLIVFYITVLKPMPGNFTFS